MKIFPAALLGLSLWLGGCATPTLPTWLGGTTATPTAGAAEVKAETPPSATTAPAPAAGGQAATPPPHAAATAPTAAALAPPGGMTCPPGTSLMVKDSVTAPVATGNTPTTPTGASREWWCK